MYCVGGTGSFFEPSHPCWWLCYDCMHTNAAKYGRFNCIQCQKTPDTQLEDILVMGTTLVTDAEECLLRCAGGNREREDALEELKFRVEGNMRQAKERMHVFSTLKNNRDSSYAELATVWSPSIYAQFVNVMMEDVDDLARIQKEYGPAAESGTKSAWLCSGCTSVGIGSVLLPVPEVDEIAEDLDPNSSTYYYCVDRNGAPQHQFYWEKGALQGMRKSCPVCSKSRLQLKADLLFITNNLNLRFRNIRFTAHSSRVFQEATLQFHPVNLELSQMLITDEWNLWDYAMMAEKLANLELTLRRLEKEIGTGNNMRAHLQQQAGGMYT